MFQMDQLQDGRDCQSVRLYSRASHRFTLDIYHEQEIDFCGVKASSLSLLCSIA